jgi:hypothetical protein
MARGGVPEPAVPDAAERTPRRRGPAARLGILAGGAVLAVLGAELVMRLYAFAPRVADQQLGFVPRPGALVRWNVEGNGQGYWEPRGVRRQPRPPGPGILVLGDSISEAMQVDDDQTYSARLGVYLRAAGLPLGVYNTGIAGASIARYAALAPDYQELLHPRWAVIQFDEEDLSTTFSPLETHFVRDAPGAPLRIVKLPALGYGGKLRLQTRILRARSALIQRVALQLVGFAREMKNWHPFRADRPLPRPPVAAPLPPVEEELAIVADAYQGRVTFLFIAAFDPAHPERESPMEREVEEVCARRGWSLVDIRRTFDAFARAGSAPFGFANSSFNTGHLNQEGHQAVARELAREIETLHAHGLF